VTALRLHTNKKASLNLYVSSWVFVSSHEDSHHSHERKHWPDCDEWGKYDPAPMRKNVPHHFQLRTHWRLLRTPSTSFSRGQSARSERINESAEFLRARVTT
jgi:hypothetical protein